MKLLKIGDVARLAGITVRTLHHYDRIGLLRPSAKREGIHRIYNHQDVERLQQVIALKSMGIALDEIKLCLEEHTYGLEEMLAMQQDVVRKRMDDLMKIDRHLEMMRERLAKDNKLSTKELLTFIKEVNDMETLYSPEQLKTIRDRMERWPDRVQEVREAWPKLFEKFAQAKNKGLSADAPEVQELAKQAQKLIDQFTGGDKEIEENFDKGYDLHIKGAEANWGVDPKVFEFAHRARMIFLGR